MGHRFDKFTKPFQNSRIPFLLAEVVTNGAGEMVDLICRFANGPAARLLSSTPEGLTGLRFSESAPPHSLREFAPLASVAFSGSSVSFRYETLSGSRLNITGYQPVYGLAACILEEEGSPVQEESPASLPAGITAIEVGRRGACGLSFSRHFCEMTGYSLRELLNHFSEDFSALVFPEDWPGLLQSLMDAARIEEPLSHEFRLMRSGLPPLWVSMQAELFEKNSDTCVFHATFFDIDHYLACQRNLRQSQSELAELKMQTEQFFDSLPGCCCLLSQSPDGKKPRLLRLSRGLCSLLGGSQAELFKQFRADPLFCVVPADQPAARAAWKQALTDGEPVTWSMQTQYKSGPLLQLSVSAALRRQTDGGLLAFVSCTDITAEHAAREELRYHAELNDLLLASASVLSFDYDCRTDTIRMEQFRKNGTRVSNTVTEYLRSLKDSLTVHPDSRNIVLKKIQAALARPGKGTFLYLGKYSSQDYRWYQVSYVSLADSCGNVCRIIADAEDVSERQTAETRFRDLEKSWADTVRQSLCWARLDLTSNRILDAHGASSHLMHVLFGNTAEECIAGVQSNLHSPEESSRFLEVFSRSRLLEIYQRGKSHAGLEHRFFTSPGECIWVLSRAELVINPRTRHIEANCYTVSIDESKRRGLVLQALAGQAFDLVAAVETDTRRFRVYRGRVSEPLEIGLDYQQFVSERLQPLFPPENREQMCALLAIPSLVSRLQSRPRDFFCGLIQPPDGPPRYLRCCVSWLEQDRSLLLTVTDLTEQYRQQSQEEITQLKMKLDEQN